MSPEWSCSVPRDIVGQVSPGVPWCPLVSLVSPCVPWCPLFSPGVPWCPLAVVPQGDEELSHSTKCYTRPVFPSQIQLLIDQSLTNKRKEELTLYESKCFGHNVTMSVRRLIDNLSDIIELFECVTNPPHIWLY